MKTWSLFKHENLTTGNKILWKRGGIAISNFRSQSTYSFVKCGCSIYFFLNSVNLTCQGRDISKYFRESLRLRDKGISSSTSVLWVATIANVQLTFLTLCLLGNFVCFFVVCGFFFKLTFSKEIFQEHHQSVKQFGSRSGPTFCQA